MSFDTRRTQTLRAVISGLLGTAAFAAAVPPLHAQTLETVTVTAQRRETDLQTTPVAITAYTGEALAENKIFTVNDLAASVPAFSLTALHAARCGTEHPRHHQHAPGLADGRSVGRHVRRRRVHGPHRRPELRLLRPRAHRGHPRPAGRAARQERGGRRAQRHHCEADVRALGQRARELRQLQFDARVRLRQRRAQRLVGGSRLVPGPQARRLRRGRPAQPRRGGPGVRTRRACSCCMARDGSAFRGRLALDYNRDETNGINTVAVAGGTTVVRNLVPAHQLHAPVEQPARVSRPHRSAQERRAERPVPGPAAHPAVHGARRLRRRARPRVRGDGASPSTR